MYKCFVTRAFIVTNYSFRLQVIEQIHSTNPINVRERIIIFTETELSIQQCYLHIAGQNNSSLSNDWVIPDKIYGIKL